MKYYALYIAIFAFLFVIVTLAIFNANDKYENIFKFDFREKQLPVDSLLLDSMGVLKDSVITKEDLFLDSLKRIQERDSILKIENEQRQREENERLAKLKAQQDSVYQAWKKETIKLYEAMDSKQVAKLIEKLSDDIARDLIYSMNKRKAAEILSSMEPDKVLIITKARK